MTLTALRVPTYTLKAMGRWKSLSYQLYTQLMEGSTQRAFNDTWASSVKAHARNPSEAFQRPQRAD
jgi:hypothetical protein